MPENGELDPLIEIAVAYVEGLANGFELQPTMTFTGIEVAQALRQANVELPSEWRRRLGDQHG